MGEMLCGWALFAFGGSTHHVNHAQVAVTHLHPYSDPHVGAKTRTFPAGTALGCSLLGGLRLMCCPAAELNP